MGQFLKFRKNFLDNLRILVYFLFVLFLIERRRSCSWQGCWLISLLLFSYLPSLARVLELCLMHLGRVGQGEGNNSSPLFFCNYQSAQQAKTKILVRFVPENQSTQGFNQLRLQNCHQMLFIRSLTETFCLLDWFQPKIPVYLTNSCGLCKLAGSSQAQ